MSYRSKRTMAETMKSDELHPAKKSTPNEVASSSEGALSERWGPFHPRVTLDSHNSGDKELSMKSHKTPLMRSLGTSALHQRTHIAHSSHTNAASNVRVSNSDGITFDHSSSKNDESRKVLGVPKSTPIWKTPTIDSTKQKSSSVIPTMPCEVKFANAPSGSIKQVPSVTQNPTRPPVIRQPSVLVETGNRVPSSVMPKLNRGAQTNNAKLSSSMRPSTVSPPTQNPMPNVESELLNLGVDLFTVGAQEATNSKKLPERTMDKGSGLQNGQAESKEPEAFEGKRRGLRRDWPDDVDFDEKEEVLTIDAEGKYKTISGLIQPHEVWHSNDVKYCVTFNEFFQPLRRGGHILIRFIGDIAKNERFCPIRETNWRHVNAQYKVDIIKTVRARFVIPNGDNYDQGILKRTGKSVRQYRHYLKAMYFKPATKTKPQIFEATPSGHPRDSWIHLVDYWYSEKGKRFAEYGKEARSAQNHVHTTGSISYANIRADFEEKNKREPSHLEIFACTHKRKDGTFVKDTMTEDLLTDVEADVYTQLECNPTNTKPRIQIENEVFNKLMYGGEIPKRPVGYGFGVKQSDVFGVRSILRKEGFNSNGDSNTLALQNMENVLTGLKEENQSMEKVVGNLTEENKSLMKQHEVLKRKNDLNSQLLKTMTTQFGQILDALGNGNASPEFLNLAKNVIHMANSQVSDSANGQDTPK